MRRSSASTSPVLAAPTFIRRPIPGSIVGSFPPAESKDRANDRVVPGATRRRGPAGPPHRILLGLSLKWLLLACALLVVQALGMPLAQGAVTVTRGPYLQQGTTTSIVVQWRTDAPSDSRVRYGPDPASLTAVVDDSTVTTEHQVPLSGLLPDTRYYYSLGTSSATLAGGEATYSFVTAPAPGTARPTRIWILGDSGTTDANAVAVRDAYLAFTGSRPPDLWLMLGDNAYLHGTDSEYQAAVFEVYPTLLRQSVLWPTIGNHDADSADSPTQTGPYYDIFTLPRQGEAGGVPSGTEAYYSFDYGNIHFISLDASESDRSPTGPMLPWLQADLAANTQPWVIAFWHQPPYSKGPHDSDTEIELIEMRQNALPVLEAGGVDLVFAGHSHDYERSVLLDGHYGTSDTLTGSMIRDAGDGREAGSGAYRKPSPGPAPHEGAVYTVAGSGGALGGSGGDCGPLNHPVMRTSLCSNGSVVLDVTGNRLDGTFLDSTGAIGDYFTLIKGGPLPPSALTATPLSSSQILLTWTDQALDEEGFQIERALNGSGFTLLATVGTNVTSYTDTGLTASQPYAYRVRAYNGTGTSAYSNIASAIPSPDIPLDTFLTLTPPVLSNNSSGSFSFTATTGGSTFECQLDAGGFAPCTSPKSYTGLTDASHTFAVRALDLVGNVDPTPASFTWTVDTLAPTLIAVSAVGDPTKVTVGFSEPLESTTATDRLNYAIDQGVVVTSAALGSDLKTVTLSTSTLTAGVTYTLTVTAVRDRAGNAIAPGTQQSFTFVGQVTRAYQDGVSPTVSYAGTLDTYLAQSRPTTNFGTAPTVRVDGEELGGGEDLSALLRWDLADIPPGSTVLAATLSVNVTNLALDPYEIFEVKRNWSETSATWTLFAPGNSWQIPGAQGSLDIGSTVLATVNLPATGVKTIPLNAIAVALVQAWVNAPATNYGMIITDTNSRDGLAFDSREASTPTTRPKLTITYVPAPPPPAPSDLTATAVSPTQIDLAWTDNASGEDAFEIERSTDGSTFAALATVGTDVTTYSDTGLSAATAYYYRVRAHSPAGNSTYSNTATATTPPLADTTPPETAITSGPANPTGSTTASFSFTASEAGSTFECQLDGSGFGACSSPKAYITLADGSHSFQVRATDPAGNLDPTPASYSWTVDTTAPDTSLTATPPAVSNNGSATFSFTASEVGSSFQCKLDAGTFAPCTSPVSYAGLADGSHTFEVRATDAAGNPDPTPASYTWTVDTTPPPAPALTAQPATPTTATSASFQFSDAEEAVTFFCKLDAESFAACTSPQNYPGPLPDGPHTFQVKARDAAGNESGATTSTWTVDTTPPDTTLTGTPPAVSNSSNASFSFSATEAGSTFECQLDAGGFAVCTSPKSYTGLADGSHSFQVRAKDVAGNVDPTPASYTWSIDITPPDTTLTATPPALSNSGSASFSFTASEGGSSFQCRLDGGPFAPCSSPVTYAALADGSHTFQVQATDPVGNTDPTPATYIWTADTTPPDTTLTGTPPTLSNSSSATFNFTATESGSSFQCRLDGAAFAVCTIPATYAGLADGSHTFEVKATDPAGNADPTPASYTWTVDATAPVISSVMAGNIKKFSVTISWTTNVPADTQVEYGTTPLFGQSTTLNTSLVTRHSQSLGRLSANTTYYYRVRSRDATGDLAVSGTFTFVTR